MTGFDDGLDGEQGCLISVVVQGKDPDLMTRCYATYLRLVHWSLL